MSDPLSITAGALGLATIFSSCLECFNHIQTGRNFGRDFETDMSLLDLAKTRLINWGTAVNITSNPELGRLDSSEDVTTVRRALCQIRVLFEDTEKISRKYTLKREGGSALVGNRMMPRRQRETGITRTASWTLQHKGQLDELATSIIALIDNIEKVLPGPSPPPQTSSPGNSQSTNRPTTGNRGLGTADTSNLPSTSGNSYGIVIIKGKAQTGDNVGENWTGQVSVANLHSNHFARIEVEEKGRVLMGNQYGVKKGFWDSD